MKKIETLKVVVDNLLAQYLNTSIMAQEELTIVVNPENIYQVLLSLRDNLETHFEECIDLCGVDYLDYKEDYTGKRFAVVYHLLSVKHNWRIRIKSFMQNDHMPTTSSVQDIYSGVSWFEREAFDMYGIIFEGHPDLRRLLTDYGFVGHPFRKDFPLSGYVEMKYDEEQKRVIYQPVTIEPREVIPRVVREENYCGRN
ncbi:MAG: NADH-quinone oxidoreductase subunit C [Burkholderiales bacterium]|nr:NADH-quinone oxidoreductase subunit C [Burkholderiales bacterium]